MIPTSQKGLASTSLRSTIIRDPFVVSPGTTVMDAIALMSGTNTDCIPEECSSGLARIDPPEVQKTDLQVEERPSCVLIVDGGHLVGMLTERDALRLTMQKHPLDQCRVDQVMTRPAVTLHEAELTDVVSVMQLLQTHQTHYLPILDAQDQLVGLVTERTLLQVLNPLKTHQLAERLTERVNDLEQEKAILLENQAVEVEYQVDARTAALKAELTERQQIEAQLRQSEATNRALLAAIPDLILRIGADGSCYDFIPPVDAKAGTFLPIHHHLSEVLPPDVLQHQFGRIEQALTQGELQIWEHQIIKHGNLCDEEVRLVPCGTDECLVIVRDITERKKAETALAEKEAHQRALISAIPDLITRINRDGIYLEFVATPNFYVMGDLADLVGTHVSQTLPPDLAQKRMAFIQRALETNSIQVYEHELSVGDSIQTEEVRIVPYSKDEVLALIQDISDRKQMELELKQQQEFLRTIIDTIPNRIFVKNRDGCYLLANRALAEYYETTVEELVGRYDVNLQPDPAVVERFWQENRSVIDRQESLLIPEERILSMDGREQWFQWQKHPITLPGDNAPSVLGIGIDITTHKEAQAILRQYERVVSTTTDGIALVDRDYIYRLVNQVYVEHTGKPQDAIVGHSIAELFGDHVFRTMMRPRLERCLTGEVQQYEHWFTSAQAGYRFIRFTYNPYLELDGSISGVVMTTHDLTALKQGEDRLRKSEGALLEAQRMGHIGSWEFDLTDQKITWSNELFRMFGLDPNQAEPSYSAYLQMLHPEDRVLLEHCVEQAIAASIPYTIDYRVVKPDGSIRYHEGRGEVEQDAQGHIIRLYGTALDITDRKQTQQQLQNLIEGTAATTGENFFPALVQHIAEAINVRYAWVTEQVEDQLQILAIWANGTLDRPYTYPITQTPCERTLRDGKFSCKEGVQQQFPHDLNLVKKAAESYLGIALHNAQGKVIGNLCILDHKPLRNSDSAESLMRVFAARAAAELEREWAIRELERLNQKLEQKIEDRTAALKVSEERWQLALRGTNDGIWDWDLTTHKIFFSSRWKQMRGFADDEVGDSPDEYFNRIHPEDYPAVMAAINSHLGGETEFFEFEYRVQCKDSSYIWIFDRGQAIRDESGQANRLIGASTNFTDRKQAEMELAKSRQQYYSLIQSVNGIVWEYDLRLEQFTFVSDKAPELLGYPISDWLTQPYFWRNHVYAEDLAQVEQFYNEAIHQKRSCEWEYRMVAADGRLVWIYDISTINFDETGNPATLSGVLLDIRDRKKAEVQLQDTNEELIRATRLKDEFLANMSHELRTPLNAILGMTEALLEEIFGPVNERQIKALKTIESSGSHLLELINDVLDVAKIESGQIDLELMPTDVAPLCHSSLAFIKQPALKKRIQLKIQLPPDPVEVPKVLVDQRRIRQVLINLLNNAVKFTPNEGHITLGITPLPPGEDLQYLRLSVMDTGIGIAPENIHKLFQPFVQIDSALNRQYQGTGLGLTLVKRIVESHGGYVGVSSELGVGSCFTIDLPCAVSVSPALAQAPTESNPEPLLPPQSEQSPQILLVEDNDDNISTIFEFLDAKGYRIQVAKTGQDAITLTQTQTPDLILMDIQMPGMDGLEATRQIQLDPRFRSIPIIALTALAMAGDRDRCLAAGATEYLSKPVKLKHLETLIQKLLASPPASP